MPELLAPWEMTLMGRFLTGKQVPATPIDFSGAPGWQELSASQVGFPELLAPC
jgi:hypothetical protein